MLILRLIILFTVGVLVVYAVLNFLTKLLKLSTSFRKPKENIDDDKLVKCSFCDTYLPQSQAIMTDNHYYCCEEHTKKRK